MVFLKKITHSDKSCRPGEQTASLSHSSFLLPRMSLFEDVMFSAVAVISSINIYGVHSMCQAMSSYWGYKSKQNRLKFLPSWSLHSNVGERKQSISYARW